uniref:Uncharacterized protein n=1 Tax=Arundo donax TaxID=35708 RepID=A0A0A9GZK3_ARUDO
MLSRSEVVFVYEKPTPIGDSKNSKLASLFHENLLNTKPVPLPSTRRGPSSEAAP